MSDASSAASLPSGKSSISCSFATTARRSAASAASLVASTASPCGHIAASRIAASQRAAPAGSNTAFVTISAVTVRSATRNPSRPTVDADSAHRRHAPELFVIHHDAAHARVTAVRSNRVRARPVRRPRCGGRRVFGSLLEPPQPCFLGSHVAREAEHLVCCGTQHVGNVLALAATVIDLGSKRVGCDRRPDRFCRSLNELSTRHLGLHRALTEFVRDRVNVRHRPTRSSVRAGTIRLDEPTIGRARISALRNARWKHREGCGESMRLGSSLRSRGCFHLFFVRADLLQRFRARDVRY
jgi:hypothetical protein